MSTDLTTAAERLNALLDRMGIGARHAPASALDLAEANAVATLPEPLSTLYLMVDCVRFGAVEAFALADFIEVNEARDAFGELRAGVFVASDLVDGWFFVDPTGFMGMDAGSVFFVERGEFSADECIPVAGSLIELFEVAASGGEPWKAPALGDRALEDLLGRLRRRDGVELRTPADPARFREPGRPALPLRLARLLEATDGFLVLHAAREFFGFGDIRAVEGAEVAAGLPAALWVGRGPDDRRYAMSTGIGWRDLPAERLVAVLPGQGVDDAPVLGRVWDVWSRWIEETVP